MRQSLLNLAEEREKMDLYNRVKCKVQLFYSPFISLILTLTRS